MPYLNRLGELRQSEMALVWLVRMALLIPEIAVRVLSAADVGGLC